MIINPFKTYCKNDLTKNGIKFVFLDTCAISELDEDIVEKLKKDPEIRVVVNELVLTEFIKGLKDKKSDFKKNWLKKIKAMEYLDYLGCLFLFSHEKIETMELRSASDNLDKLNDIHIYNPHDSLNVFRQSPFEINYSKYTFVEYLDYLIDNIYILKEGLISNVKNTDFSNERYNNLSEEGKLKKRRELNECFINKRLESEINLNSKDINKLLYIFNSDLDVFFSFAPHYSMSSYIYYQSLSKNGNVKKKQKVKENDFMDGMHRISAMSYCDMIISNDKELIRRTKNIKENFKSAKNRLQNFEVKKLKDI